MTYNPYQGDPNQYQGGHLFFTGPGYTQPLIPSPSPTPAQTTPTGGLADPTGGTGGGGERGEAPSVSRNADNAYGAVDIGAIGRGALGIAGMVPGIGPVATVAGLGMKGNNLEANNALRADFGLAPVGFVDSIGAMLGMNGYGRGLDRDSMVADAFSHAGFTGAYDPSMNGPGGNVGGGFGGWGGSAGVGWGGDPDGFGGMSGNMGAGDGGGGSDNDGGGASDSDGGGGAGWRRGGLIGYAQGGMPVDPFMSEGGLSMLARGRRVGGPGGGQDDVVPAMLSTDEYVIPADVVAHLGDGNPQEGGLRIDRMIENIRTHKTSKGGKHPPMAKPVERYMPKGRR